MTKKWEDFFERLCYNDTVNIDTQEVRATNTQVQPWWETTEFDFIRIPKELYRNPYYSTLSQESKLLYGFLLDRASLSRKMGEKWHTEQGQPFVIFTLAEFQQRMGCSKPTAAAHLKALETRQLIRRSRPKKDGPYHIVVNPFATGDKKADLPKSKTLTCPGLESLPAQVKNLDLNNTDNNKTDSNNTDTTREDWVYEVKKNIAYDILCMDHPRDKVDAILEVMVDTLASSDKTIRVGGQIRPMEQVRKRILEADIFRIQYILPHMRQNSSPVQSYRAYFLARLWEPEGIVAAFYDAWVRRDMEKDRRGF